MNRSKEMAKIIYQALSDKKGEDIRVINISNISTVSDYFIITHGNTDSQVNALVENVEEKMDQAGFSLKQREGKQHSSWVLLDYGDVVLHVFDKENRGFYALEKIWNDGIEEEM